MDFSVISPTGYRIISIDLPVGVPYAALVSGGLDSAVMLALLLMTREREGQTETPLVALNVQRGFGTERFSKVIVAALEQRFEQKIELRSLPLPAGTPHQECLKTPVLPLLLQREYAVVFSADTSNPPDFHHEQAPSRLPAGSQFASPRWRLPFLHCDKSHTVGLMLDLDLVFIEDESHTCFAQDEFRCGACFQCEERAWAYRTLGLVDRGLH